jgi:hypothetical protein
MPNTLDPQYMAEMWQSQADHWRNCYFRLLGQKIQDGKVVRGHVSTPSQNRKETADA